MDVSLLTFVSILIVLLNALNEAKTEELVEVSCFSNMECKQFEHAGIRSDCKHDHCHCTTATGEHVQCKPMEHKLNNIIGGPCPCGQPNSDCNKEENICYCAPDFMPSNDKRRCIKKTAALMEECELDSQCQRGDYNAICNQEYKKCMCMEHFISDSTKCISTVGPIRLKFVCDNDTQCADKFGEHVRCLNAQCICADGYITALNNSHCQKISKYLENCNENIQCIASMGLGGKCMENSCLCDEKYLVEEKKTPEGVLNTICSPFIKRGQYCRYNEDCYQRQLNESAQSMMCRYGECDCKSGFNVFNDGDCYRSSGELKLTAELLVVVLVAFVNTF